MPNPRLSLVREGIELAKREGIDLVLAIGGGSVIDSAKAIGLGTVSEGDVWDYFIGEREPEHTLPVAVLLTCPATGSESSQVAVVNNTDEGKKLLVSHPVLRPKYAFMGSGTDLFPTEIPDSLWCNRYVFPCMRALFRSG